MTLTNLGNYIQLASHILVLFGFREISQEESNAIAIVIGIAGELIGFVMTHVGRYRLGGVNFAGMRKPRKYQL